MRSRKQKGKTVFLFLFFGLFLMPSWGRAEKNDSQERILSVFYPYRQGPLRVKGITPGMRIDRNNFQVAQEVLPPLKQG